MAGAADYWNQIKQLVQDMDRRQQIIAGAVVLFVIAAFAALFIYTNRTDFATLYSDMEQADAAEIVKWLQDEKIPYRLVHGGTTVQVPADKVYDIRLALAGAGLPRGGSAGFKLFDKTSLGATDFVQQVNYQRALQGELERTIDRFPQVKSARVHVAMPKESLFVSERQPVTASVVLTLKRGAELSSTQIESIVHLVAGAVPRLDRENVSVVDTTGRVLYEHRNRAMPDESARTNAQLVYQRRLEEYYKHKISSLLEDALGPGSTVVQVSAEIDFDRVETSEDQFDPDSVAVRSEHNLTVKEYDRQNGGIPGVKGGLAGKLQGNLGQKEEGLVTHKKEETRNYEITRVKRNTRGAIGKLRRLSVGVLVDGTYTEKDGARQYSARTPEEMTKLRNIVRAAMGFSEERGDDLSIQNVPFSPTGRASETSVNDMVDLAMKILKPLGNLVLALLFIFLVLRPLLNRYVLAPREEELAPAETALLEGGELPEIEAPVAFEPAPDAAQELKDLANDYPERAAALIKVWLREKEGGKDASGQ